MKFELWSEKMKKNEVAKGTHWQFAVCRKEPISLKKSELTTYGQKEDYVDCEAYFKKKYFEARSMHCAMINLCEQSYVLRGF